MAADNKDDDQTRSFTVLTAGTVISHYKIISRIGAGGMGDALKIYEEIINRHEVGRAYGLGLSVLTYFYLVQAYEEAGR